MNKAPGSGANSAINLRNNPKKFREIDFLKNMKITYPHIIIVDDFADFLS